MRLAASELGDDLQHVEVPIVGKGVFDNRGGALIRADKAIFEGNSLIGGENERGRGEEHASEQNLGGENPQKSKLRRPDRFQKSPRDF